MKAEEAGEEQRPLMLPIFKALCEVYQECMSDMAVLNEDMRFLVAQASLLAGPVCVTELSEPTQEKMDLMLFVLENLYTILEAS